MKFPIFRLRKTLSFPLVWALVFPVLAVEVPSGDLIPPAPAQPLLSDFPQSPTRQDLENLQIEGLTLASLAEENAASGEAEEQVALAVKQFLAREDSEDLSTLEQFFAEHGSSPWAASLRVTYGLRLYHQARFSEALAEFESAWQQLKDSNREKVRAASVSAAAELASLYARLGRKDELAAVLSAVADRPISGNLTEKIRMAAEGLESMQKHPEHSFKCGPYALASLRKELRMEPALAACLADKASTEQGVSMAELQVLVDEMEMDFVAARREARAELALPALVHWKLGHYAAILKKNEDGRYLVHDPTFLHDFLVTEEVLEEESSGNFLVPSVALAAGWTRLTAEQAAAVWGKGAPTSKDPDDSQDCSKKKRCGMAEYEFDFYKAGLVIRDTPLWYEPSFGPGISFDLTYRQRGEQVLDASSYGFGPKWTSNWSSYLQQADAAGNMTVFLPGGERETHSVVSGSFTRQKRSFALLIKTSASPETYELQQADGSAYVFSRQVTSTGYPKFFLTSFADPQGNAVQLVYDASNRLVAITDPLGQVSNFYYENPSFPSLVTKISDPFVPSNGVRRSVLFTYSTTGRLEKITDAQGIESSFQYDSSQPDFIRSLSTPYGATTFTTNAATSADAFVEVSDPLGRKERVEFRNTFGRYLPEYDPATEVPDVSLIQSKNSSLYYGSTLYWDKKTYVHFPPNPTTGLNYNKAEQTKWMWHPAVNYRTTAVVQCIKKPFESRIWYEYPGQVNGFYGVQLSGTSANAEQAAKIGRRVTATETQVDQFLYNDKGMMTQRTDTLGRVTRWNYAANGIDLLSMEQKSGASWETLQTFSYDPTDPPRQPRSVTDAAGQTTTYSWNTRGQLRSITAPGNLVTTLNYDASSGFLENIDGPLAGTSDRTSFTPDLYRRVRSSTQPGGYTLTFDYDNLDRPTQVTYPDGTTEQFSYQRANGTKLLDLTHYKDRENRWTFYGINALRQRVASIDPAGRNTRFVWCYCGELQELSDGAGNVTKWSYDIGARLTGKTFADGRQETYTYDLAGRLDKITDAKGQVKTHSYFKDNQLSTLAYTNSTTPTANVSFTYDAIYGRLATMSDGTGTTSYTYHANTQGTLGAGRLKSIDSPLGNDLVEFSYDAQSRFKSRSINGAANSSTVDNYDELGRVTQWTNPLGVFNQTYDPVNLLPKTSTAPNGMVTALGYENATADLRLKEIKHTLASNLPLAKHNYTYRRNGSIATWQQTLDSAAPQTWTLGYDAADQLTSGTRSQGATVSESHGFQYDKAGNRTSRQRNSEITQSTHNNVNQITGNQVGSKLRVSGSTDEPAKVKVNGKAAQTNAANFFEAWVDVTAGQNTLTVEAEDYSPTNNKRTNSWTVNVTGTAAGTPSYDLNGNMTNNGAGQTYQWDAENRLIKITYADLSSTDFAYDGLSRRTRITEKNASGVALSDKRYVWSGGNQPAEERDAASNVVTKRFFEEGEQRIGGADAGFYYYAKDHLGSIREITNSTGAIAARYDFDLWGKRTKYSGTFESEVGYTGHHHHAKSGLILTWYRAYDADLGRWLSADPIGEQGGLNLYGYVLNNPTGAWDPLGLCPKDQKGNNNWFKNLLKTLGLAKKATGNVMGGKNKWYSGSPASSIGSGITKGTSALIGPTLQLAENGPDIYEMADAIDKNRRLLKELDDLEMSDDEYQNTQKTRIQGYCPK